MILSAINAYANLCHVFSARKSQDIANKTKPCDKDDSRYPLCCLIVQEK